MREALPSERFPAQPIAMVRKKFFSALSKLDSIRAFLERWGLWQWVMSAAVLLGGFGLAVWAWLESRLPYWAIAIVGLGAVATLVVIANSVHALVARERLRRHTHAPIDRESLAKRLEDLSRAIATLVGEFRGPLQSAWWADSPSRDSPHGHQMRYAEAEGKLVERYSARYAADVWICIATAGKIVPLDRGDLWQIQHGIRSEHELVAVYQYLAMLAAEIRHPNPRLPMTDRRIAERMEVERNNSASLPDGLSGEK